MSDDKQAEALKLLQEGADPALSEESFEPLDLGTIHRLNPRQANEVLILEALRDQGRVIGEMNRKIDEIQTDLTEVKETLHRHASVLRKTVHALGLKPSDPE